MGSDPDNCGACGTVCSTVNDTPSCAGGVCTSTCNTGYMDCDNNLQADGCETDTASDKNNCGACAMVCNAMVADNCTNSTCMCGTNAQCTAGTTPGSAQMATLRIWRGNADGGHFEDYSTPVTEGSVVLDAVHRESDLRPEIVDVYNGYGCNMSVRLSAVRADSTVSSSMFTGSE